MGRLRHAGSEKEYELQRDNLIGRTPESRIPGLQDSRHVSFRHAQIVWRSDDGWLVRDLGSTNGTDVNGLRLVPTAERRLRAGDSICFGHESQTYELFDISPPDAWAQCEDGRICRRRGETLALPSEEDPAFVVYEELDGRFVAETLRGEVEVRDGEPVVIAALTWTLHLPEPVMRTEDTRGRPQLESLTLHFRGTFRYRRVSIALVDGNGDEIAELPARAFTPMLYYLAHQRLDDVAKGLPAGDCGWVSKKELCRYFNLAGNGLHNHTYRARKQLEEAGVLGARWLIQRGSKDGEMLRLGTSKLVDEIDEAIDPQGDSS